MRDGARAAGLLAPAYLWLLLAVFLPLSAMLYFSLLTEAPFGETATKARFSTDNYAEFFSTPTYAILLWKSLKLGVIVTVLCVLVGSPCAWVLAKVIRGRAREALFLLVILPFWSNSLVRIFSWAIVLRGNGVLDTLLPGGMKLNLMYSQSAIVIGLVHSYLPYTILTAYLALQAIDDTLLEAARSLGAKKRTILWRLVLPLAAPGIIAGAVLVFVPVVGSFMEPRLLGGRVGTTYGTLIEDQFVAVFNWPLGAALSFILLAVVLIVLAAASPALRKIT